MDPYIEQPNHLLLIDLFLLKPSVYRHLLFNKHFTSYHRLILAIIVLSLESSEYSFKFRFFYKIRNLTSESKANGLIVRVLIV